MGSRLVIADNVTIAANTIYNSWCPRKAYKTMMIHETNELEEMLKGKYSVLVVPGNEKRFLLRTSMRIRL